MFWTDTGDTVVSDDSAMVWDMDTVLAMVMAFMVVSTN